MLGQPSFDRVVLVGGVVVHDQVRIQICRGFPVQAAQKLQPLLMTVPGHAEADRLAGQHVQGGKQRRGAGSRGSWSRCLPFFKGSLPAGCG